MKKPVIVADAGPLIKQASHVPALKPMIRSLREHRYHLSDALVAAVLQMAGE